MGGWVNELMYDVETRGGGGYRGAKRYLGCVDKGTNDSKGACVQQEVDLVGLVAPHTGQGGHA